MRFSCCEVFIKKTFEMNHSQRTYGPALSDIFSSDVLHSILSSPTDTLQALNEAVDDTKIKNVTQSTKTKIQKFYNGDFVVRYNGTFAQIRSDLRKLFSMDREGATDYAVYDIPNGRMAFRLADHNANGNNFEKDNADSNISVYVAIKEYPVPESEIPFTEYKIAEETFNNNREVAIRAIVDAVASALSGKGFSIPESIAERHDYPINESKTNKNMKKNIIKLNESQLRKVIAESVKKVLKEGMSFDNIYNTPNFMFADEDDYSRIETTWEDYANDVKSLYESGRDFFSKMESFINKYSDAVDGNTNPMSSIVEHHADIEDLVYKLSLARH